MCQTTLPYFSGFAFIRTVPVLIGKIISNQLNWYINLRFITLTQIGIIFLAILALTLFMEVRLARTHAQDEEHAHDHDHAPAPLNLWIMLIPLLVGVLIPAKPLILPPFLQKDSQPPRRWSVRNHPPNRLKQNQNNAMSWIGSNCFILKKTSVHIKVNGRL